MDAVLQVSIAFPPPIAKITSASCTFGFEVNLCTFVIVHSIPYTIESVIIISVSLMASRILGSAAAKALLPPINTTFLTLYFSHTPGISL